MMNINELIHTEENEISAFCHLPYTNLVVTGHEKGDLILWNHESCHSLKIEKKSQSGFGKAICALKAAKIKRTALSGNEIIELFFAAGFEGKIYCYEVDKYIENSSKQVFSFLIVERNNFSTVKILN